MKHFSYGARIRATTDNFSHDYLGNRGLKPLPPAKSHKLAVLNFIRVEFPATFRDGLSVGFFY